MTRRALFLDRDGIFNVGVMRGDIFSSPRNWDEVHFYEGLEGLADIKSLGYLLILVTNQPCVERGFLSIEFLNELHAHYQYTYGLDAVYCCPFASSDHPMKKPNPGMLLQAAKDFELSLPDCYFLGDTDKDTGAARNTGMKSILWDRPYNQAVAADFRVRNLNDVLQIVGRPYL